MQKLPQRVQISIALLILGLAIVVGAVTSYYNQHSLQVELENRIEIQRAALFNLAEVVDKNGADSTVKDIITDCSKRAEFDTLLSDTASLAKKDLITLQTLIDGCGSYFPLTKAIMVAQLEREFQMYKEYVELKQILDADGPHVYELEEWEELIEFERKRSSLLKEQVDIQSEIVSLLIEGYGVGSSAVQEQIKNAQNVNILLTTDDTHIDEIRTSLTR